MLILTFIYFTLIGVAGHVAFLACYCICYGAADWWAVVLHGLRLDVAIAGYLSLPVALITIASLLTRRPLTRAYNVYFAIIAFLTALGFVANLGLYGYWGFPLDRTPVVYFLSSPAGALASLAWWQWLVMPVAIVGLAVALFLLRPRRGLGTWLSSHVLGVRASARTLGAWASAQAHYLYTIYLLLLVRLGGRKPQCGFQTCPQHVARMPRPQHVAGKPRPQHPAWALATLLLAALMIIPIRGGFATGTNHTGSVYYCDDMRLNHAAVNPLFSFFDSMLHVPEQVVYDYMPQQEADSIVATLVPRAAERKPIATASVAQDGYTDGYGTLAPRHIYLVVLESFSRYIMSDQGHVRSVVPVLDSLWTDRQSLCFTRCYASSFRTDRGLVSVLNGLPSPPTMNVMMQGRLVGRLPSIARSLRRAGYATQFYYGGDAGFSDMRSYVIGTGYQRLTEQSDFPRSQQTGKWGVADGPVYRRVLADARQQQTKRTFTTIMTASSHEPFDVPDYHALPDPCLNAFHYADHCLGQFLQALRTGKEWGSTLVVIVPDHLGAYPQQADNYQPYRWQLPLVFTGGAVAGGVGFCPHAGRLGFCPSASLARDISSTGDARGRKPTCPACGQKPTPPATSPACGKNATSPARADNICSQSDIAATLLSLVGVPHGDFPFSKDALAADAPQWAYFSFPDAVGMVTPADFVIYDNVARRRITGRDPRPAQAILQCVAEYLKDR